MANKLRATWDGRGKENGKDSSYIWNDSKDSADKPSKSSKGSDDPNSCYCNPNITRRNSKDSPRDRDRDRRSVDRKRRGDSKRSRPKYFFGNAQWKRTLQGT